MKPKVGLLFLPCGPGFNSAPAQVFLTPVFRHYGPAVFWDEPSEQRGQTIPDKPKALWKLIVDTLEEATNQLPEKFVIVTESFGSVLSEALFRRMVEKGTSGRVLGILHTPPVMDLRTSFLKVLLMSEEDFIQDGDEARLVLLRRLIKAAEKTHSIADPALLEAIVVAFESPKLLPRFFRNISTLNHWASGFGEAGYAPEPEMRERILHAMSAAGVPGQTTFGPDVPTFVCSGEFDPYQSLDELAHAIDAINSKPGRIYPVHSKVLKGVGYYPYVDVSERWEREILAPFWGVVALPYLSQL